MEGKICLVTGATSGIGLVTALGLAQRGATVVLAARNSEKAAAAATRIRDETGNTSVAVLLADLSVQAEVRRLAQGFLSSYPRLDVLVNNAGAFFHSRHESADGIEMTWALNLLAPFLLTNLLLPRLKASAPARILNVSSFMHRVARIDFEDLEGERGYLRTRAYGQSKLGLVILTYEFARRLNGAGTPVLLRPTSLPGTRAGGGGCSSLLPTSWLSVPKREPRQSSTWLPLPS
jgi:NAD(P)-dependent dehydrogenase (short-subunit alcohol dehydrogenase family)